MFSLTRTTEMDQLIQGMDPFRRAQIILLCDLCKTAHLQSHCDRCDINLCKVCVGEHLENTSIRHNIVPYKYRKSLNYSKCPDHAEEQCKQYCEKCDIPVCSICVSSGKHKNHDISDILEKIDSKTESLQKDLEELETRIYPRYEEMAFDVQSENTELEKNYGKMTTATDQQGELLHQEITAIVNQRKSDINKMKNKHLFALNENRNEIIQKITQLKQIIADLKSILKSNDVSLTATYKSRNSEFRTLPPKVRVTIPSVFSQKINNDQLNEMFGFMSSLSINTEHGGTLKSPDSSPPVKTVRSPEVVSSPSVKPMTSPEAASPLSVKPFKSPKPVPAKQLRVEPRFTATIDTGYTGLLGALYSVTCLNDDQIWTRGNNKIMRLVNLQGRLLTSIQTKSGNEPWDIAVTRNGDLVYTDYLDKTVNLVKDKQIRTMIKLQGWGPRYICTTTSDNLLVTLRSDDHKESKVVRYFGSTETQTIQYGDQIPPLYSSYGDIKYISENRNLDICVADWASKSVVVVNQSGKLRFRYTGHPFSTDESFRPNGITTDSQSHILTTDFNNDRIHILDQDGRFLRYIHNLQRPWGLCVDSRDNLFVAEWETAKVKKIQYLQSQC